MVAKVDAFSEQCFDLDKVGMGSPPSPSQGVLFGGSLGSSGSGGKWELDRNSPSHEFGAFYFGGVCFTLSSSEMFYA